MQKTFTVMNDLHRISDKIAENTRQTREASGTENQWSAASAEPEKNAESASSAPVPPSTPVSRPVPAPASVPSALLERRYADFLRTRRDLLERLTEMSAKLEKAEKNCSVRLTTVKDTLASVQNLLNTVPPEIPEKASFADRSELSETMLTLEKLRLETIRLSNAFEQEAVPDAAVPSRENQTPILLDSLTFRQIFRASLIATLPFIIALLIASLIVAAAVIGSFKGMF